MHGKVGMRQIIDALQAQKIFAFNYITSATNAIVRIEKMKERRCYEEIRFQYFSNGIFLKDISLKIFDKYTYNFMRFPNCALSVSSSF